MNEPARVETPFRWDLVTPAQLGGLLDGVPAPSLWFLPDLVTCAGKVVARSGHGDLVFVGRSLDSMHDLLSGAFAGPGVEQQVLRLPVSLPRAPADMPFHRWRAQAYTRAERAAAYAMLASLGLAPGELARRRRPATFVDVVHAGNTFTELFHLLREFTAAQRAPWAVVRRKLRFVGVTRQTRTSPSTWRWQQHASWTGGVDVVNVPLHPWVWSYFGDHQVKLTRSFRREQWRADRDGPRRDDATRAALAEAVALVEHGRSREGRRALAAATRGEPALSEPWLRRLVHELNR